MDRITDSATDLRDSKDGAPATLMSPGSFAMHMWIRSVYVNLLMV